MFPFEVDEASDLPLWVQLRQRLIYLISSGYFKPGDRLPTVRGLASEISINYNTVNKAYLSLVSDGYLESTRGRGVFVRDLSSEMGDELSHEVDGLTEDYITACRDLGLSYDDVLTCVDRSVKRRKMAESHAAVQAGGHGRIVEVAMDGKGLAQTGEAGA